MLTEKQVRLIEYGLLLLLEQKEGGEELDSSEKEKFTEHINETLLAVKAMQE